MFHRLSSSPSGTYSLLASEIVRLIDFDEKRRMMQKRKFDKKFNVLYILKDCRFPADNNGKSVVI